MEQTIEKNVVAENVLSTEEACALIDRTRQMLQSYVKKGLIAPLKKCSNQNIYYKDDVLKLKAYLNG